MMMDFQQHTPPKQPDFEVMASAYATAMGLGNALRATDALSHQPATADTQSAVAKLRAVCEETRKDSLELAELLWATYRTLETEVSGIPPSAAPFQRMLDAMRESEAEMDRGMAEHQIIRDIMMPLRRATAKARSNASLVVNLIRQKTPGAQSSVSSKADPEGLRELARVNTQLLREKCG
ncbi:hypothetical protein SAMN05421509_10817 [Chromohalobacter canadensis]|uniref:Uncharacterized protein n=1 Tax=Chromohalobacter canadensis TaxID=141389 RepID=A0A285VUN3_9GAMM|nr:hypothetical protein [Chromohalobacter canadensis]SOC56936.1 hypothetical protein SAMN05421509_10817 [Chromohalobacter canadensis]